MKTIVFFNNKGGVGKTTLVYHLAHMLPRLGYPTVALDLDPQANLSSAFFDEEEMEVFWNDDADSIMTCVRPILEGTGDIAEVEPRSVADNLWIIPGDLALSGFEDKLSTAWPYCLVKDLSAIRATSAFHRIALNAVEKVGAEIVLFDVGPNLGAINRTALLAADYIVVPLAADLFSLQGLKNLGPQIRTWREDWGTILQKNSGISIPLPSGSIHPLGYVVLQHAVRLDRPTKAYQKWVERIPNSYREYVLKEEDGHFDSGQTDPLCLATLKNYRSLMPMSQEARKPIFDLRSADGALGSHSQLAQDAGAEFENLARRIMQEIERSEKKDTPS